MTDREDFDALAEGLAHDPGVTDAAQAHAHRAAGNEILGPLCAEAARAAWELFADGVVIVALPPSDGRATEEMAEDLTRAVAKAVTDVGRQVTVDDAATGGTRTAAVAVLVPRRRRGTLHAS